MFRKSKTQQPAPPTAPGIEEILEDVETFKIPQAYVTEARTAELQNALLAEPDNLSLKIWWQVFDDYEHKVKKLAAINEKIDVQKTQLQSCKRKLENNAEGLRVALQKQLELIQEGLH
ncbi:uncharacterized protein LOC115620209 [Scaptodrosophila lebanonensis]|uniref:Uncharacterized protein LOC115620209 n=1 Tax=Drosophila lebanonensis TaxID=7225 RepID=A0A6J2SX97_DROLE|nr:uncharacterized protein LOC115620209 [Scaptodrosophila lebanonensis]